ncbi:hypothetical protein GCM10009530_40960 [Microbispora corallina]|uniref:Uncharacterized protein n=1 Tax=Microbispora corallina TaxID=83302 RepID=A0ABQ4G9Y6_9ACTN|nr:hypothetical protein [Microbispora corallina]GIH43886.1 hypothetical protein Mco01_68860 [Microbispora corallina]
MSYPPLYDERPAQRRRGRGSERTIALVALVIAAIAVLIAAVLAVLLVRKTGSPATAPVATASPLVVKTNAAPTRRPAQPKTRAGARLAAQKVFDLYTSGQYGPFWDRWTSEAQRLVSRRDYVRRFRLCPSIAQGIRIQISAVSVTGDHARVTAARSIATFVYDFQYERGVWRFVPDADQQKEYQTKSVDQIVREERVAGMCG